MFISGFDDARLNPCQNLQYRGNILSVAQRIWRDTDSIALAETLHLSAPFHHYFRGSVFLRRIDRDYDHGVGFNVTQISSCPDATNILSHWKIRTVSDEIVCVDAGQDLLIVRDYRTSMEGDTGNLVEQYYCLSIHSLTTGGPHPLARRPRFRLGMSDQAAMLAGCARGQVFDNTLAISILN